MSMACRQVEGEGWLWCAGGWKLASICAGGWPSVRSGPLPASEHVTGSRPWPGDASKGGRIDMLGLWPGSIDPMNS